MGDVLKAIAAIVLVGAAVKYAAHHVVNKAIAKSGEPGGGFEFECKPLEIPETNFNWNANWMADTGVVWQGGRATGDTDTPQARSVPAEPTLSYQLATPASRERAVQARKEFESMRKQHDAMRKQQTW
ncbi:MAG TPA: hypothetical protein VJZ71_03090 [Phycisphaerae bacterium]|nr:hypothetical protein [Phycisphaerae bacterium]